MRDLLCFALTFENSTLFVSLSDVDHTSLFTFRVEHFTSLDSFSLSLELHASLDACRWLDIFDLVSHDLNAPDITRLVK